MRYLNYLSYKLADPEITLICRQNPICEVLPFPRCACHTWNKDLSPTEILLVAFPAEMSLYGSNCIKEAKSCVQPRVALGWGGMVELQQEQPGLGKDSVPELPGSALRGMDNQSCRLSADIHLGTLQGGCQAFRRAILLCGSQASSRCLCHQSITYLDIKIQHAEKEKKKKNREDFSPLTLSELTGTSVQLTFFIFSLLLKRRKIEQENSTKKGNPVKSSCFKPIRKCCISNILMQISNFLRVYMEFLSLNWLLVFEDP